jgi:hypothetical protein
MKTSIYDSLSIYYDKYKASKNENILHKSTTKFTINQYTCTEGSDLVYTYGVEAPVCRLIETENLEYNTI